MQMRLPVVITLVAVLLTGSIAALAGSPPVSSVPTEKNVETLALEWFQARYTNVHVKKSGQWVLQSVRETPYSAPGNYEHLRGLEWAIGEWVDEEGGPEIDHATFEWSPDGNFLISTQDVTVRDTLVSRSTEWIGWDPATSQIRSWSFVADGSGYRYGGGSYGGGYHYGGGTYYGGGYHYAGGVGYYGGGFHPGSFLAGYASGVYSSQ